MKRIVINLLKRYHSLGLLTPIFKTEREGTRIVNTSYYDRSSIVWDIKDRDGKPDDEKTQTLINKEKNWIADNTYRIVREYLKSQGKLGEHQKTDVRRRMTNADKKIEWVENVLFKLGVTDLYETAILSGAGDEENNLGYQRKTSEEDTEEEVTVSDEIT